MNKLQQSIASAGRAIQQMSNWLFEGTRRLFSASDDDYPESGAQPFEGEISNSHHRH